MAEVIHWPINFTGTGCEMRLHSDLTRWLDMQNTKCTLIWADDAKQFQDSWLPVDVVHGLQALRPCDPGNRSFEQIQLTVFENYSKTDEQSMRNSCQQELRILVLLVVMPSCQNIWFAYSVSITHKYFVPKLCWCTLPESPRFWRTCDAAWDHCLAQCLGPFLTPRYSSVP